MIGLNVSCDCIPQLKLGNIQNRACREKYLKDNKHNSLHWHRNMLGYLPLDIICSSKLSNRGYCLYITSLIMHDQVIFICEAFLGVFGIQDIWVKD